MFDSQDTSDSSRCIFKVAMLVLGLIFSPAFLLISLPVSYLQLVAAATLTTLCLLAAWLNREKVQAKPAQVKAK